MMLRVQMGMGNARRTFYLHILTGNDDMSENSKPEFNIVDAAEILGALSSRLNAGEDIAHDSADAAHIHGLAQILGRDTATLQQQFEGAWQRTVAPDPTFQLPTSAEHRAAEAHDADREPEQWERREDLAVSVKVPGMDQLRATVHHREGQPAGLPSEGERNLEAIARWKAGQAEKAKRGGAR